MHLFEVLLKLNQGNRSPSALFFMRFALLLSKASFHQEFFLNVRSHQGESLPDDLNALSLPFSRLFYPSC